MSKPTSVSFCPCGSGEAYKHCCGKYISGEQVPTTAESLMRSRYTAYTQANIAYIELTMRDKAAENFNAIDAEQWAKAVKWKRLKVISTFTNPTEDTAYVEFMAYYIFQGAPQKLTEISKFKQIAGKWYYIGHAG